MPLARAIVVPPLCMIANLWRGRKRSLKLNEMVSAIEPNRGLGLAARHQGLTAAAIAFCFCAQIFLVFAGLRGAIAFALARNATSAHRRTMVAATTAVIVFTTFVLGGLTLSLIHI